MPGSTAVRIGSLLVAALALSACGDDDSGFFFEVPVSTATPTSSPPASATIAGAPATPTPTSSRSPFSTPSASATATLPAPSTTPVVEAGPVITFLGVTRADDMLLEPVGATDDGAPIFERRMPGSGFSIVVEGRRGASDRRPGQVSYDVTLSGLPDLLIAVDRPLGNGDPAVCEDVMSMPAGIPAIEPLSYEPTAANIAAFNDLGCRFRNGRGDAIGRSNSADSCILFPSGLNAFLDPLTDMQFCGFISRAYAFPLGETRVTVRLRDDRGNLGPSAQLVIRVTE